MESGETGVRRRMREDNLLCVRKRKFVVTTDSNHARKIPPNLARNMMLTCTDQLGIADITHIRLQEEFAFLAVILDAYSRRVMDWALDRTLEDELTLAALRMALARRVVEPGLVHHSDRGSQYVSGNYTGLLQQHAITISMSRKGNPMSFGGEPIGSSHRTCRKLSGNPRRNTGGQCGARWNDIGVRSAGGRKALVRCPDRCSGRLPNPIVVRVGESGISWTPNAF